MLEAYKRGNDSDRSSLHQTSPIFSFFFAIDSSISFYKFPHSPLIFMATKANMNSVTSDLTEDQLKALCEKYDLLPEYGAELPLPGKTALEPPRGKITLYSHFFTTSHLRIPVSKFLIALLKYYRIHITQISPISLQKVFHYEFCVRSLREEPDVIQFRAFYKLTKSGDWWSFSKRDGLPHHVDYVPSSLKFWKESFFYINAGVFPFQMSFRDIKEKFRDDPPPVISYTNSVYHYLTTHITDLQEICEDALVAAGMSRRWEFPGNRPVFTVDGKGTVLLHSLTISSFCPCKISITCVIVLQPSGFTTYFTPRARRWI
jgi:hypothetical protein